jgi:SNF2 family DNA or RNA helicase
VAAGADVVVTSYTLLRLEAEQYAELTWSVVLLDEAQFVKNRGAQAYTRRCASCGRAARSP